MQKFRGSLAVLAGVLMLSGCAAGVQPEAAPSATPDKTLTSTPTVEPTSEPTTDIPPTASPAIDPTCETVLTEPAYAEMAGYYTLKTELQSGPDPIMASLLDQGGLSCYWVSPGGDVVAWFAQAATEPGEWSEQRSGLLAEGYTESDEPVPGTLQGPRSGDAYPTVVNAADVTYYVSESSFLASVAALQ